MGRSILAVCVALLVGCATNTSGPKGISLDSGIQKLIPPDTVALAGVNVAEVLKTPVYGKFADSKRISGEMEELARRAGLDWKKDLYEVYMASNGKQSIAIARVNVADPAAVERELEAKGAKRMAVGNRTVLTVDSRAVSLLDGKLALAGPLEAVRAALEGAGGDDGHRRAVLAKLAGLPRASHVWAVSVGGFPPMPVPERGNLANLNRVFAGMESTTLSVDLADGVTLAANGDCADEKAAKQLHDTLRGLIGFGRLSTPADKSELLKVFDGIDIAMDGNAVRVNVRAPLDVLDQLSRLR